MTEPTGPRARLAPRFLVTVVAVAMALSAVTGPAAAAVETQQEPDGHEIVAASKAAFSMNLYRPGDFVTQYTKEWCVAAALQIILNVTNKRDDRSMKKQIELFDTALKLSHNHGRMTTERGWAATLNKLGVGPYEVRSTKTRAAAIHMAADAMRRTNRPVGLLTWWGAHSWVMHGFTATADPRTASSFEVTSVYVSDPWYPKVSTIWGPSLPPNSRMTVEELHVDYIPWIARAGRTTAYSGKFVLIVPLERPSAVAPKTVAASPTIEPMIRPAGWSSLWHDASGRWVS